MQASRIAKAASAAFFFGLIACSGPLQAQQANENEREMISAAASALDKAAKRGSIHKNSARRRRSRIAKAAGKAKKKT